MVIYVKKAAFQPFSPKKMNTKNLVLQKVVKMLEFLQKIVEFFAATDYKNEKVAAISNT
jgi:hypothetical protein